MVAMLGGISLFLSKGIDDDPFRFTPYLASGKKNRRNQYNKIYYRTDDGIAWLSILQIIL
jgi:hypothetical protein